jgi:hypothetical protein
MDEKWQEASADVIAIARDLIEQYHPTLRQASIGFLFRDKPGKSQGREVCANAQKVPESLKPFLDYDFIIWVARKYWEGGAYGEGWKLALIDHVLCHCRIDPDKEVPYIVGHDFEDFHGVIQRHGFWSTELRVIKEIVKQPALPGVAAEVTIEANGKVVAMSVDQLQRVADNLDPDPVLLPTNF